MLRRRTRFRSLDVPLAARNRALDYLANALRHRLSDDLRYQLTQVLRRRRGAGGHRVDAREIPGARRNARVLELTMDTLTAFHDLGRANALEALAKSGASAI
jgi:hypothetical protein